MLEHGLAALYAFDGKRVAGLRTLARSNEPDAALIAELPGEHEVGASWVLKARAEAGVLSDEAKQSFSASLADLTEPDAILHVLQMVQYAPFASADVIRPFLAHKRTLLRVWALDAMVRVAPQEAAPLVQAALNDESAAMRARARVLEGLLADHKEGGT